MMALAEAGAPVWMRAVVTREGHVVVTRCCVVTGGQFFPIEVRVDVRQLGATLRALGLVPPGTDAVGGFGSFLKKAVKAVTKNKITQAVGKVVGKVARSPLAMVVNPSLAISAHTISKGAGGKGTIKGPLGQVVDLGSSAALSAAGPAAKLAPVGSGALSFVSPRASAALGVGLQSVMKAQAGGAIASAARQAQGSIHLGRAAAAKVAAKTAGAADVAQVRRAVDIRKNLVRMAPALAKRATESAKIKSQFAVIAKKAQAGSAEAQLAARVIGRSAQAVAEVARLQQSFAGGVPGLLVTSSGRIVKAPRGKFLQTSQASTRPDVLYRGRGSATLRGSFTAVSGAGSSSLAWPSVGIDPAVLVGATKARRRPVAYKPEVTRLRRELASCGDAYDELWQLATDMQGGRSYIPRYDDPRPAIDVEVGATPSWGGALDPGQEIEGPFYPLAHPDGRWQLDDYGSLPGPAQIAGALTP